MDLIKLHDALLEEWTLFHRGVVLHMSIQSVAYVNSWLLESDTLDINIVKTIS